MKTPQQIIQETFNQLEEHWKAQLPQSKGMEDRVGYMVSCLEREYFRLLNKAKKGTLKPETPL